MAPSMPYSGDGRRLTLRQGTPFAPDTHAGLWLDKFLRVLNPSSDDDKQAIRDLIRDAGRCRVPYGYESAFARREARLRALSSGVEQSVTLIWDATVLGRMVVGLGTESLRETNLTLQHTWGVPVVPGSALKGVAASAAHRCGGDTWRQGKDETPCGDDHRLLFGDTTSAGFVTFHDAWWIPSSDTLPLDLDIMTVHHREYYGGEDEPPADWDEPNPVPFMTSRGCYLVALTGPRAWVDRGAEWLQLGLERFGIGGKTRAGYGRMKMSRRLSDEEQRIESILRRLGRLPEQHNGKSSARQHLDELYAALGQGVPAEDVADAGRNLWNRDSQFWKKWRKEQDDATRQKMAHVGLVSSYTEHEKPRTETPDTCAHSGKATTATVFEGVAWIETDRKGRPEVHVRSETGAVSPRKLKDVVIAQELIEDLHAATHDAPQAVSFEGEITKKGIKPTSIRKK